MAVPTIPFSGQQVVPKYSLGLVRNDHIAPFPDSDQLASVPIPKSTKTHTGSLSKFWACVLHDRRQA